MRVLMESQGDVLLNIRTCCLGHPCESKRVTRSAACCEQTDEMFKREWLQSHSRTLEHDGRKWRWHVHQDMRGVGHIDDSKWFSRTNSGVPPLLVTRGICECSSTRICCNTTWIVNSRVGRGRGHDVFGIEPHELVEASGSGVTNLKRA